MKNKFESESLDFLKKHVKKDTNLIIQVVSVSKSGMTRRMNAYTITRNKYTKQNELVKLNWAVSKMTGYNLDSHNQLVVNGCGMDMAFALQDDIKRALFSRKKYVKLPQIWQTI